jgi:hypothetical protein
MTLLNKVESNKRIVKALTPLLKKPDIKKEIGRRIIDAIKERTQSGLDKNEKEFKKYSKDYIKSPIFKIWGKSASNVNLLLTGDMQANIDVVKVTGNTVEIGFTDSLEEAKAEGHIKGANYLPVRNFWGLPNASALELIMLDVINEHQTNTLESQIEFISEAESKDIDFTFTGI